jgi:hypothetical protein
MDIAVSLFIGFIGLIVIGSLAFIGLAAYVDWTGYTHKNQDGS